MKIRHFLLAMALLLALPTITNAQVQPYFGGIGIGSQMPKGFHVSGVYIPVSANQLNDPNGNAITAMDLGMGAFPAEFDMSFQAAGIALNYVSDFKILGATYGAGAIQPYAVKRNLSFLATDPEGNTIPLMESTTTGFFDLVVTPMVLGWSGAKYDISAALSLNIPTGNYDAGAGNRWCFLPSVGGTYYFDKARTFSASSKVTFELNGPQRMEGLDLALGDEMIVEWGLGKMIIPIGRIGIIGYSVFQLNQDQGAAATSTALHSSHSIGAEYSIFVPPLNIGFMARGAAAIAAKDCPPVSIFMFGLTKSFGTSH